MSARRRVFAMALAGFVAAATVLVPALAEDIVGRAKIIDGDTLDINGSRVRLNGIDAPEKAQLCETGQAAWAHQCDDGADERDARRRRDLPRR